MKDIELIYKLNKDWRQSTIKVKKAGGQTNRNWIVKYKNKKFFVRFPWGRSDIVDRKAEARNVLALAGCNKLKNILPKFYLYVFGGKNILCPKEKANFPNGTMITEYIEGGDINGEDLKNPKIQTALIKTLHTFHSSGVRFFNSYDVFRDEILKYEKKAKKYPIEKLISKERIKNIEKIEEEAKRNFPLGGEISTHNDLIFENLFLGEDGKIYLLDFEYAGFNIRDGFHYDLGIILGGNLFQENPIKIKTFEEILKKAEKIYKKKLDKRKIYFGALINVLVMFWWGLVKYFSSTTKTEKRYFLKYILDRARGIDFLYRVINKNKAFCEHAS
ncbi:MAG: phosphotransferase [bacterium]|nr:phosphotransferase [bacterium]